MKHCDDYIDDESQPLLLRRFIRYWRWPAIYRSRAERWKVKEPKLFADYTPWWFLWWRKTRVRAVLASRMGDVGVTPDLKRGGYRLRVAVSQLSNFSEQP